MQPTIDTTMPVPMDADRKSSIRFNDCFAVGNTMIDVIHPATGKSACFGQTLEQIQERYPGAIIMTIDAYCKSKAASQDTPIEWLETSRKSYDDMSIALPPTKVVVGRKNCSFGFLMGEPYDHHALSGHPRYGAFISRDDCYFTANRPLTIAEFEAEVDR